MKKKLLSQKELHEKLWWWKHEKNRAEMEWLKNHGLELAARNYELMRRSPDGGQFQQTYLNLDGGNKTTAAVAWTNPIEMPNRVVFDLQKSEEAGWTSARPHLQWNLRLSDRVLRKVFIEYINQHRFAQKVVTSNTPKGKKNRPPSWLYVEYLDMKRNKISDMDDSQRGMASKAEELAIQLFAEFNQAEIKKEKNENMWGIDFNFNGFS
jgi:hypothetical protein